METGFEVGWVLAKVEWRDEEEWGQEEDVGY